MSKRQYLNRHFFHLVDISPWPITASFSLFLLTTGAVLWFHCGLNFGILFGLICLIYISILWWRDVIRESTFEGHHTIIVQNGLRYGMLLFIVSEIMFFFSFFWAFFHSSLAPTPQIGGIWPPVEYCVLKTWSVPFINTEILLTSGASVTWAHYAILKNDRNETIYGFIITIFLALLFTFFQLIEYFEAKFSISDGVYGSVFFMATGFHGLHVIIGTIFLIVSFIRFLNFHFSKKHHLGFQVASWYWHFVDAVWIFLFITIYWWGNSNSVFELPALSYEI
jgi:cytochrome c oxidase subunit 3